MKKIVALVLSILLFLLSFSLPISAVDSAQYPIKREELRIRDPFVLPYDGKYYMYGTGLSKGKGYGCVVSEDLENWSEKIQVFSPSADFDGYADFWAPECHYYNGSFYLFGTYRSRASEKRGTAIFKSDSPLGPFELISDGHITPKNTDCIDGTLYVDEEGQPWMVFVNEWTSSPDEVGEMSVVKLSDDLTHFISEPKRIFRANNHIWTRGKVTDGPFVYKTTNGNLIMLWSNSARSGGYAVGMAVSDNGKIDGNWLQHPKAIYKRTKDQYEGGHAMIFETFDGEIMMAIHSPNGAEGDPFEKAQFIPIKDTGSFIEIEEKEFLGCLGDVISNLFYKIYFFVLERLNNIYLFGERQFKFIAGIICS